MNQCRVKMVLLGLQWDTGVGPNTLMYRSFASINWDLIFKNILSCHIDEQHFTMAVSMPRDRFSKH